MRVNKLITAVKLKHSELEECQDFQNEIKEELKDAEKALSEMMKGKNVTIRGGARVTCDMAVWGYPHLKYAEPGKIFVVDYVSGLRATMISENFGYAGSYGNGAITANVSDLTETPCTY